MIEPGEARGLVLDALRKSGDPKVPDAPALLVAEASTIRRLPRWATRVGLLQAEDTWWLYVERRRGGVSKPFDPGQVVMDLAAGRYTVETLDVDASEWLGLESAAGGPLVAGLACPARAALLRIRRVTGL